MHSSTTSPTIQVHTKIKNTPNEDSSYMAAGEMG